MCMIEEMREQAKKDMARYRREYGKPETTRPDLRGSNAKPTRRQRAAAALKQQVLQAMRCGVVETTSEIGARMNKPARGVASALTVLHQEGRVTKYPRPDSHSQASWILNGDAQWRMK